MVDKARYVGTVVNDGECECANCTDFMLGLQSLVLGSLFLGHANDYQLKLFSSAQELL